MYAFIGVIGFLAAIVFLIMGIVSKARKKPSTKRNFIIAVVAFIIFIGALSADPGTDDTQEASGTVSPSPSAATVSVDTSEEKAAEDKAAEEAKQKAAEEAKAKEEAEAKKKAEEEAKKPKLEVLEHNFESDEFTSYVTGIVQNNTDKEYSYVQIEINGYSD
ncbi:FxLYD domain-containing protein [Cohnella lubricantis]|uniref:Uncharacterized protein n=1 Tax=Cohnella lubricantis TaxID=2163172 RepID=A0A841T3Q3_9BACL|nr:FxLYD domain-containing protein [Cohnella lubricantis]MBB6675964.1 hypothetical protein [Cohnella lubricantis]MBP2117918.1 apolipoprotein N-acyltransferase [Cohnella lubricantis]